MEPVSCARSFWAALLTFAGDGSASFGESCWSLRNGSETHVVEASELTAVRVRRGMVWSTLELVGSEDVIHRFGGLAHRAANHLHGAFTVAGIPPRVAEATLLRKSGKVDYPVLRSLVSSNFAVLPGRSKPHRSRAESTSSKDIELRITRRALQ